MSHKHSDFLKMTPEELVSKLEEKQKQERILSARLRLRDMAPGSTLEHLLQATLDEAEMLTGSCIGFYHHFNEPQKELTLQAWSTRTMAEFCRAEGNGLHYPVSEAGVWVDCIRERRAVIHNDYASLPHRKGMPEGHAPVIRELVVPVFRNEKIVAILGVGNKPVDYDDSDVETATLLADLSWDIAEEKRTRISLDAVASRYRALAGTTLDAYWELDRDGFVVNANEECCALYGYGRDELIGMNIREFEVKENPDEIRAHIERIITTGYDRFVTQHKTKDGKILDLEISTSYMPNLSLFLAFTRDITEQVQAIDSVERNARFLREAQRIGNLGVYDYDIVNDHWSSSPEMDRIFGIDDSYPRNMASWSQIIHPELRDSMVNYFLETLAAKSWFDMEYRIIRPNDGAERWLYGTGEFMLDGDGKAVRMIGTIADVTEQKTREIALRQSEELYRQFSSLTTDYVYSCVRRGDEPYRVRWMAGAVDRITGYTQDEIFAAGCWLKFVHPDDAKKIHDGLMNLTPGITHSEEFRLVRKDGTVRWIHEVCKCEKGSEEGELKLFGTSCDVTQRKQHEHDIQVLYENLEHLVAERTAELNRTNEELASFSYSVSHELRAPIARLQGFSKAIIEDFKGDRELGFLAKRIEVASLHLQQVVDAILMLSRLSRTELDLVSIDMSELAQSICTRLFAELPAGAVEAVIQPGMKVSADLKLITVCLENLIGNAVKYTSNEPKAIIEIGTWTEFGETVYFVRDNGAGFDMAYADKLYLPFQRLHQQDEYPGMGIGLATVQRIVERHGGRLWAEGSVGGGATFYFTLTEAVSSI